MTELVLIWNEDELSSINTAWTKDEQLYIDSMFSDELSEILIEHLSYQYCLYWGRIVLFNDLCGVYPCIDYFVLILYHVVSFLLDLCQSSWWWSVHCNWLSKYQGMLNDDEYVEETYAQTHLNMCWCMVCTNFRNPRTMCIETWVFNLWSAMMPVRENTTFEFMFGVAASWIRKQH